jgi:hypothetical protein
VEGVRPELRSESTRRTVGPGPGLRLHRPAGRGTRSLRLHSERPSPDIRSGGLENLSPSQLASDLSFSRVQTHRMSIFLLSKQVSMFPRA